MKKELVDKMTLQEAMDYAVKQIVAQGGRCMNEDNKCRYSDGAGRHCAVGWLLDEDDDLLMSSSAALQRLPKMLENNIPDIIRNNLVLFQYLQRFHDYPEKESRKRRRAFITGLFGIDTSGEHWEQWIEMGD